MQPKKNSMNSPHIPFMQKKKRKAKNHRPDALPGVFTITEKTRGYRNKHKRLKLQPGFNRRTMLMNTFAIPSTSNPMKSTRTRKSFRGAKPHPRFYGIPWRIEERCTIGRESQRVCYRCYQEKNKRKN